MNKEITKVLEDLLFKGEFDRITSIKNMVKFSLKIIDYQYIDTCSNNNVSDIKLKLLSLENKTKQL